MRLLESLGYSLYASLGTADFYTEHGVKVQLLPPPHTSLLWPQGCLSLFLCFYDHLMLLTCVSCITSRVYRKTKRKKSFVVSCAINIVAFLSYQALPVFLPMSSYCLWSLVTCLIPHTFPVKKDTLPIANRGSPGPYWGSLISSL